MRANLQLPRLQLHIGAIRSLPMELEFHGISKPLLISDKGVSKCGVVDRVLQFAPIGTVVFDQVTENPLFADSDAAAIAYVDGGCDCIIAVGGGSVIDAAKLAAVVAGQGGRARDYAGFSERITRFVAPLLVIPTTAGTGSECSPGAGVHPDAFSRAEAIGGPFIIPRSAICDPELTLTLPANLTAATGIDALTHCVEGFLAEPASPIVDTLALDGIKRLSRNIEEVARDGQNLSARLQMMIGAFAGGVAIQKGLGPAHAIANACGDQGVHHGKLSAIGLLASLALLENVAPEILAQVHHAMHLSADDSVRAGLRNLMQRLGLPVSLSAAGYKVGMISSLADNCAGSHFNRTCPYKPSSDEYAAMIVSVRD